MKLTDTQKNALISTEKECNKKLKLLTNYEVLVRSEILIYMSVFLLFFHWFCLKVILSALYVNKEMKIKVNH